MACTHLSLHYHLIFSTKERYPYITTEWRHQLHAYIGGIIKTLGGIPEMIGGVDDHVHILIGLRATHCLANVLREIKCVSSKWVHEELNKSFFSWQEGYGAFSVSASQIEIVKHYIQNQETHHLRKSFQDEYLALLKYSHIKYDEKYLW